MASKTAQIKISLTGAGKAAAEAKGLSGSLERVRRSTLASGVAGASAGAGMGRFGRALMSVDTKSGMLSHSLGLTHKALTALKYGAIAGGAAVGVFGTKAIKAGLGFNAAFQSASTSFKTLLGSAGQSKAFVEDLRKVSNDTPLHLTEVMDAAKTMLGMGVSAKKTTTALRATNDAILATGGDSAKFDQASLALSEMAANGKASQEQIRQLAVAGVPVNKILQKQLHLTADQVKNIGTSGISADRVLTAITKGWTAKFGKAAANARNDWNNQIAQMQKDWEQLERVVTAPLFEKLNKVVLPALSKGINKAIEGMGTGGISGMFAGLDEGLGAGGRIVGVFKSVRSIAQSAGTIIKGVLVPAFVSVWDVVRLLPNPLSVVAGLFRLGAAHTRVLRVALTGLIGAYVAYRTVAYTIAAAQGVYVAATRAVTVATKAAAVATRVWKAAIIGMRALGFVALLVGWVIQIGVATLAMKAAKVATRAWSIAVGVLNVVMRLNPIMLVVTALILIAAAFVLAYKKVKWFRNAVNSVWTFIKKHWPLLLSILTGPIGAAVIYIIRHWNKIKHAVSSVVSFVKGKFSDMVSFIRSIPGKIAGVGRKMFHGLLSGAKSVFNAIAGAWNSTVGSLGFHLPKWVPGIGGKGFNMPKIPTLYTGGTITGGGLSLVGERGPELVSVPRGSQVYPSGMQPASARAMAPPDSVPFPTAGGGGLPDVVIHTHLHTDGRETARSVERVRLRDLARA